MVNIYMHFISRRIRRFSQTRYRKSFCGILRILREPIFNPADNTLNLSMPTFFYFRYI